MLRLVLTHPVREHEKKRFGSCRGRARHGTIVEKASKAGVQVTEKWFADIWKQAMEARLAFIQGWTMYSKGPRERERERHFPDIISHNICPER